jgi:hypothetical protein
MVKQDKSAYWTPTIFFKRKSDGKYFNLKTKGGILVYYLQRGQNVQPFPDGFRLIAGDSHLRNFTWPNVATSSYESMGLSRNQDFLRQVSSGFNCLNYDLPPNPTLGNHPLPADWKKCKDGIRGEVNFPSCWNGKDVDVEDHHSHMAYPSFANDGDCPDTHPIRLVTLLFEVIFDPLPFLEEEGDLILSNGDLTGYSFHADFQNAWDTDVLRRAINECTDLSGEIQKCDVFDLYTSEENAKCTLPNEFPEPIWGPLDKLPGCNPDDDGPAYAPKVESCNGESEDTSAIASPVPVLPKPVQPVKPVEKPASGSPVYVAAPNPAGSNPQETLEDSPECPDINVEGPTGNGISRTVETHKDENGNDVKVVVVSVTVTHFKYAATPTPKSYLRRVKRDYPLADFA